MYINNEQELKQTIYLLTNKFKGIAYYTLYGRDDIADRYNEVLHIRCK